MKHIIKNTGFEYWDNDKNRLHREDGGPAAIWPNGSEFEYKNHKLHMENEPAIIYVHGTEEWWINGHKIR